jgi:hypothetical protein
MTYKDIMNKIGTLSPEQKNCDASVLLMNSNEVIPVLDFVGSWQETPDIQLVGIDQVDGILDQNHPFFTIDF